MKRPAAGAPSAPRRRSVPSSARTWRRSTTCSGARRSKRPSFDFQGVTEKPQAFLKTAVAFEDLAVAAYKGQATNLKAESALAAAVAIHSVEARHAAWMRYLFGANPARSAFDKPASKQEVTQIVRSTNFVTAAPATKRKRAPKFTG